MKDSNTKLRALPANSANFQGENSSDNQLSNAPSAQIKSSIFSQTSESNKNTQHFEAINDTYKSMIRLIDTLFDHLQLCADEENKSNEPELILDWQRPILEKQGSNKSWLRNIPDYPAFTGKIYTRDWSLIVKGTDGLVTAYVIPSDRAISFNTEPEIYSPYLTINCLKKGNTCSWQIDNEIIAHEHLADLAKNLLKKLLKSARSQEWSQSVFCLERLGMGASLKNQALAASKNAGEAAVDPEQFLIDLLKGASRKAKTQLDNFVPGTASSIAEPVQPTPPTPSQDLSQNPAEALVQASVEASTPALAPNPPPAKSGLGELCAKMSQPIPSTPEFETTLKLLLDLLDQKLEQVTKEGGEAFSKHDLKGAQDMLTLSNQLNEFKNQAKEIMIAFKIQH